MNVGVKNSTKIQILDYQKPVLPSGQYKIQVTQAVNGSKGINDTFQNELAIIITGDRFALTADAVHACFPPEGSLGSYTDILPHISLKKSTLPWERSAYGDDDDDPWMALLLFDESELLAKNEKGINKVIEQTVTVKDLSENYSSESDQTDTDPVKVIDVEKTLLEKLLPTGDELKLLAHVRRRSAADSNSEASERAIVAANRLPRSGSESTVYLVSLEGRYNKDKTFNYNKITESGHIRLVTLKKWGFACPSDNKKSFKQLIAEMDDSVFSLPEAKTQDASTQSDTNRLNNYLRAGYVPLPHRLRQCDQTYSWYHGPLSSCAVATEFTDNSELPQFADELMRYHQDIGMFDVSYAAAFEIGRSMALADMQFSADLYQWKQHHNEAVLADLQQSGAKQGGEQNVKQLMGGNAQAPSETGNQTGLERAIGQWLGKLQQLVDLPFRYLVPENRLLPSESIRFFQLDQHWLECLVYGASSIGGAVRTVDDEPAKTGLLRRFYVPGEAKKVTGCIVRSQLVAGYPDLQIDAYPSGSCCQQGDELKEIRIDRLGAEVLLVLFEGEIATVDLYLKPEGLHFGWETTSGKPFKWRDSSTRVLAIKQSFKDASPASIAMKMFAGSNRRRFSVSAGS